MRRTCLSVQRLLLRFASSLALILGSCSPGYAVDFAQNGKVEVITALNVTESTELDFGAVADNDGTITLNLTDTISADPSGIHKGGTAASGHYTVTGEPNKSVTIGFAGSTANGLTIGSFTTSQADPNNVALGGAGSVLITIGADLTVDAATATEGSDHLLSFTVSVTYN